VKTIAFLTHDWGVNEDGSKNHEIVSKVNDYLKANGIVTWFDNDRMAGSIQHMMADGVDNRKRIFAAFLLFFLGIHWE
jgi:hypothetical protein